MNVKYVQKCAQNAIELLKRAKHTVTGEEFELFYQQRAMPLLEHIAQGKSVVINTEDYQKLLDNQRKPRKKAS